MELLQRLCPDLNMASTLASHKTYLVAAYTDTVHIPEGGQLIAYGPTTAHVST
ncbi:hypothetical protein ACFT38_39040 [Streptomyces sp. NPDC056975]|uniref:hypothetical protein n=1 Tax=Streptomyces sp. NPDC056975 TaxID=3345985 RepID=UPI003639E05D